MIPELLAHWRYHIQHHTMYSLYRTISGWREQSHRHRVSPSSLLDVTSEAEAEVETKDIVFSATSPLQS